MIHHVYANRTNIGDWLSAKGIQQLLGVPVVEHLCDGPFVPDTLAALAATGPDDIIVIGGGGLLMDYFDPFWEGLAGLDLGSRTCWWGLGCVDLKNEPSLPRAPVQSLAQQAAICVVRDELSRAFLHVDTEPVPCPSLSLRFMRRTGNGLLHVANYTTVGPEHYDAMVELSKQFAARESIVYRETNNRIEATEWHLAEWLSLYERSAIVVSSALHGCVIGLAMGAKVVAVSGDRKIEEFMRVAGLADWVLPQDRVEDLSRLLAAIEHQPSVTEFIAETRHANQDVAAAVRALAGSPGQ